MDIAAIATDYDGTLAENDRVPAATVAALARFRATGRKLILVSGRHLPDLKTVFDRLDLFDIAVLENGGLLYFPATDSTRPLAPPPPADLVEHLRAEDLEEFIVGETIIATKAHAAETVRRALARFAPGLAIILNTDSLMVLPEGIDKASGLAAALAELGLEASSIAAIGDAENDMVFLGAAGTAVAVANALPAVKAIADRVTTRPRGAGVAEFIDSVLGPAR